MSTKKKQLEAISQAAIADADALAAVYGEAFTARLSANLEAIAANTVGSLAQQHAKLSQQIVSQVAQAYAAQEAALEIHEIPIPRVRLAAPEVKGVDVGSLLPTENDKPKLRLA